MADQIFIYEERARNYASMAAGGWWGACYMVVRTETNQKQALDDGCLGRSGEGTFTFYMLVLQLKSLHLQLKKRKRPKCNHISQKKMKDWKENVQHVTDQRLVHRIYKERPQGSKSRTRSPGHPIYS